jgi:hypothetical protein
MASSHDPWGQGEGFFCANEQCALHVTASTPGVSGSGHWAVIDGVIFDRHSLELGGPLYCSDCRKAMTQGGQRTAAEAA